MDNELIIFDFDGTIADTLGIAELIMHDLAPEFGLPKVSRQEIMTLKHKSIPELLQLSGMSWTQVPLFVRRARSKFKLYLNRVQPIPGMPETLQALHSRGYRMGILTSNVKANVRSFLSTNELEMFEFIHAPRSLFGKSAMIKKILKKYKVSPTNVIMVGDEIRDIQAAHKAEINAIAVSWGFNSEDLLKSKSPNYLVNYPDELLKIFC